MPTLAEQLRERFADLVELQEAFGELTADATAPHWVEICTTLRDEEPFAFEQMVDLCGVDYAAYGQGEWATNETSRTGFSRGVTERATGRGLKSVQRYAGADRSRRFGVVVHLLSYRHNRRLRLRCFAPDDDLPVVPSLVPVWRGADWFEREAFDLYGIVFEGHPDLRRILTDYGFIGHPFRKDFPLIGQVEMRYDPERGRVVYEPVSIEARVLVPRVIRHDHRYQVEEPRTPERAQEGEGDA